jgi:hypothetical protein
MALDLTREHALMQSACWLMADKVRQVATTQECTAVTREVRV